VFVVVQSDVLCGTLHCDISAVTDLQPDNFRTSWTQTRNWTVTVSNVTYWCRAAQYPTFYAGPDRPDPGLVPDGASCGTGKVGVNPSSVQALLQEFSQRRSQDIFARKYMYEILTKCPNFT